MAKWEVLEVGCSVVLAKDSKPVCEFLGNADLAEIARKLNAFDEMLAALKEITYQAVSWHRFHEGCEHVKCDAICASIPACERAVANAEAANV